MSPTDLDTSTEQTPRDEPARETAGGQLLAARRRQGLSLGDVARQLKLSVRQVEALERDDHASFAGPVFVRGFLRNYAKLLGLDADALLTTAATTPAQGASVTAAAAPEQPPAVNEEAQGAERGGRMLTAVVIVALVGVALVLLASNLARDSGKPAEVAAVQTPAPAPVAATAAAPEPAAPAPIAAAPVPAERATSASAPQETAQAAAPPGSSAPAAASEPVPAPAPQEPATTVAASEEQPAAKPHVSTTGKGSARVQMEFEGESWVEVRDGSGATIFARLNAAGTKRVVRGDPPLSLVVGNAGNVKVTWHDKPVELQPHPNSDVARITLE